MKKYGKTQIDEPTTNQQETLPAYEAPRLCILNVETRGSGGGDNTNFDSAVAGNDPS